MDILRIISKSPKPRLFRVAPLTASICWIFAIINLVVGIALYFIYSPMVPIAIIGTVFTLKIWGYTFFIMGFLGSYALISNRWNLIRRLLVIGLCIKLIWLLALIIRCVQSPESTILLTAIWASFAAFQAVTFIFFLPELTMGRDSDQQ